MLREIRDDIRATEGVASFSIKRQGTLLTILVATEAGTSASFPSSLIGEPDAVRAAIRDEAKNTIDGLLALELERDGAA